MGPLCLRVSAWVKSVSPRVLDGEPEPGVAEALVLRGVVLEPDAVEVRELRGVEPAAAAQVVPWVPAPRGAVRVLAGPWGAAVAASAWAGLRAAAGLGGFPEPGAGGLAAVLGSARARRAAVALAACRGEWLAAGRYAVACSAAGRWGAAAVWVGVPGAAAAALNVGVRGAAVLLAAVLDAAAVGARDGWRG